MRCCPGVLCQPQLVFGVVKEAAKFRYEGRAFVLVDGLSDILIDGWLGVARHTLRIARDGAMREGDRTLNQVFDAVAAHFAISREELLLGRGVRRPRRVAMYLALRVTRNSLPQIGARFGGTSSTNVLVAYRIIERAMAEDADFAAEVEGIKASLLIK